MNNFYGGNNGTNKKINFTKKITQRRQMSVGIPKKTNQKHFLIFEKNNRRLV
jgi:hypothetical protein